MAWLGGRPTHSDTAPREARRIIRFSENPPRLPAGAACVAAAHPRRGRRGHDVPGRGPSRQQCGGLGAHHGPPSHSARGFGGTAPTRPAVPGRSHLHSHIRAPGRLQRLRFLLLGDTHAEHPAGDSVAGRCCTGEVPAPAGARAHVPQRRARASPSKYLTLQGLLAEACRARARRARDSAAGLGPVAVQLTSTHDPQPQITCVAGRCRQPPQPQ
jgi:hypothetical protein